MNAAPPPEGPAEPLPDATGRGPPPTTVSPPAAAGGSGTLAYVVIGLFLAALGFGLWGAWQVWQPAPGADPEQARRIEALQQRIATLEQSDQVSRAANADLQKTLAERDEEIAGLQADVAFYERFVGATGQRRGLAVHALELRSRTPGVWQFTVTLTQSLNRGEENVGSLTLQVEGSHDGRMQQLDWAALRQQPDPKGVPYAFRYFQRLESDILLPEGFQPVRVTVRVAPRKGAPAEYSFAWADAVATVATAADG